MPEKMPSSRNARCGNSVISAGETIWSLNLKNFDNAEKRGDPKIDVVDKTGETERRFVANCRQALHLAAQLPSCLAKGDSGKHLLDPLGLLMVELTRYIVARGQLGVPQEMRSVLNEVLNYINNSQKVAAEWLESTRPALDLLARSREMQRAYQPRRGVR